MKNGNSGNTTTIGIQKNYQGEDIEITEKNFRVFWNRAIHPITMLKRN